MPPTPNLPDSNDHAKRTAAEEIIARTFSEGLAELCRPAFLSKRYTEFRRKHDPIYVNLLNGMNDEPLAKTFVSYWTIAQTLATQSRFWLEDAIAEIITSQALRFGRLATHVYTQAMLGQGYLENRGAVANLGEVIKEHVTERNPWRPPMKKAALDAVDLIVGEQEREHVDLQQRRKSFLRHDGIRIDKDQEYLARVAAAVAGPVVSDVAVQCNLMVVEPPRKDARPHLFALRFVNPKTISSHAQRKQERANLLRLYAYLVQEKVFRDPESIQVCIADLLPRQGGGHDQHLSYSDYFSPHTYWTSKQLWDFIGVPFSAVEDAICKVGKSFRKQLAEGLRYLLPESRPLEGWGDLGTDSNDQLWKGDVGQFDVDRERFLALMRKWHAEHRRPDQACHCESVMQWLEQALKLESVPLAARRDMILAALGHDLYEDSKIPPTTIVADYGPEVDRLIQTLTEGNDGVPVYVEQVVSGPEEARLIKLCDGIDNYGGLVENGLVQADPAHWVKMVRSHMEPMFSRLETIPFRQYPKAGSWLSQELKKKRERFWAIVEELLGKSRKSGA